jgi:NAD(P)-dependent dehydrogenase (short-subunit alcohol dehydrogenase family)
MKTPSSPRPVALVTGGFRGIGLASAQRLARAGFNVALNDREDPDNRILADQHVAAFAALGVECLTLLGDISIIEQHAALLDAILARWGRIDCLLNNAGVPARQRGDILEVTPESFDRCIQVNTRAVFFLTQAVARAMLAVEKAPANHRSIITITSSNAISVAIARSEYCVSKAGASMATRAFAVRLANLGIGVYEVRPGLIETDMTRPAKARYDAMIANHFLPNERWGTPDDVAATVVTLAEGRLPYTVGQSIEVDGGLTMRHY